MTRGRRGKALRGVVALDGPSGTGKSTVARRLASALGARYLDTGAMYRAVTLAGLRAGIDFTDRATITEIASRAELDIGIDPDAPTVRLNGTDVATDIRRADVTGTVSAAASVPAVRAILIAQQRRIIAEVLDTDGGIVVEGRDIGAVVAPDAGLKVYLTATADARAHRRSRQDSAAGRMSTVDGTRTDVDRRDSLDTRTTPLQPAEGAIELDTTHLDADGVVAELASLVDERRMCVAPPNDPVVTR